MHWMVSAHILGSGLHHSDSLRVAAWINVEGSPFVLSVRSRCGSTVIGGNSQILTCNIPVNNSPCLMCCEISSFAHIYFAFFRHHVCIEHISDNCSVCLHLYVGSFHL